RASRGFVLALICHWSGTSLSVPPHPRPLSRSERRETCHAPPLREEECKLRDLEIAWGILKSQRKAIDRLIDPNVNRRGIALDHLNASIQPGGDGKVSVPGVQPHQGAG